MKTLDISTPSHPNTFCLLDDEDYEWAKFFKWTAEKRKNLTYVMRTHRGKTARIHREVMRARAHEEVDHADSDGLNNQKSNLRICSTAQNQQNRTKRKPTDSKSGSIYKGVFFRRRPDGSLAKPFAYINVNKRRINLGTFDTEEEAAMEYDSKALYYFKEFARLNFPASETTPSPIREIQ